MSTENREATLAAYKKTLENKKQSEDRLRQCHEKILETYAANPGLWVRRRIQLIEAGKLAAPYPTIIPFVELTPEELDLVLAEIAELEERERGIEGLVRHYGDHLKVIEKMAQNWEISLQAETPTGADRALPPKQENDIRCDIATNNSSKHRSSRSEIVIGIMHSKADFRDAGKIKALCEALHNAGIPLPRRRGDKWTPNEPKSWLDYITMAPKSREHKRLFDPNGGLLSRDLNPRKSSD